MKRLTLISLLLTSATWLTGFADNADQVYPYQLDNGLKLIVKVDKRAPVIISEIWYGVGSSYEYSGITGVSHVLEH
ncbi:MAG TPA: insulinase family protein, partial [Gammaproteobacteria bacterium]|nr:insulinase family protein [Gammaproteobacteria bacterium]